MPDAFKLFNIPSASLTKQNASFTKYHIYGHHNDVNATVFLKSNNKNHIKILIKVSLTIGTLAIFAFTSSFLLLKNDKWSVPIAAACRHDKGVPSLNPS